MTTFEEWSEIAKAQRDREDRAYVEQLYKEKCEQDHKIRKLQSRVRELERVMDALKAAGIELVTVPTDRGRDYRYEVRK